MFVVQAGVFEAQAKQAPSATGPARSVVATVILEFDETHERRFGRLNSLLARNGMQGRINVRKMICGDVADERTRHLVVAHAAMQPAQEQDELQTDGNEGGYERGPVNGHWLLS
jgi:hypothetical protein